MSGDSGNTPPAGGFGSGEPGAPIGYAQGQPVASGAKTALVVLFVVGGFLVLVMVMLAVLGVHGVKRKTALAKQAEARHSLGRIGKDAVSAFEREEMTSESLPVAHFPCDSASQPVPRDLASVRGKKYQSTLDEWDVDRKRAPRAAGFACLKFYMEGPQWYQYAYAREPEGFTATAQGDVNGDGVPSRFVLRGRVHEGGDRLDVARTIEETSPDE